jgi:hypothetical protein
MEQENSNIPLPHDVTAPDNNESRHVLFGGGEYESFMIREEREREKERERERERERE